MHDVIHFLFLLLMSDYRLDRIATVGRIRFAPTEAEIVVIVAIWIIGIPKRSISFTIVAPQRVQVPQVEVSMTASTPATFNSCPISRPNFSEFPTAVPVPVVE